ncbi:FAD-binding protein [Stygiolobus caldivivus]|uniref:FAD linked oxidase N-terminal domain-containing protein n=1 Tax=Stygiolobus caldivivus TaxID=2824673 RepID=A0A8D5U8H1_9CREN|nr:FAD-binding protein [Stygiolobus caldivivus]BCU70970.1 hypothetical protein KN1_22670 [Stygiolobus caldivivus]
MDVYSEEELFKVIRSAYEGGLRIQVLGKGKHGKKEGVDEYVYTRKMDWFEIRDGMVEALAGADIGEIRKEASEEGLLLPTLYDGTIGGLLATNFPSPLSTAYGKPIDFTNWVRVLTPYGGIKWKMLVGSKGVIGAISRAELRLYPKPNKIFTYEKEDFNERELEKVMSLSPLVLLVDYQGGKFRIHSSYSHEVGLKGYSVDEGVPLVEVNDERKEIIVEGDDFDTFKKVIEVSQPIYAYWIWKSGMFILFNADTDMLREYNIKYYTRDQPKEVHIKLKKLLDVKGIFA